MPRYNPEKVLKLRKYDNFLRKFYFWRKNNKVPSKIIKDEVKDILVLAMLLIGDTIMFIPALRVLKKNFPCAKLTLICGNSEKLILQNQNLVDEFILVKCPWVTYDYSVKNLILFLFRFIHFKRYDLMIDFRGDWRNLFFMNFLRSTSKISYNFVGGEYLLTHAITPDSTIKHFVDESLYLLKMIGCEIDPNDKYPVLRLSCNDMNFLTRFKEIHKLDGYLIIGVHPGASQEVKRWDENKYSELIFRLSKIERKLMFLIFEGPKERDTVNKIERELEGRSLNYKIIRESLSNYIKLINLCDVLVCNDSGAAHIAGSFSIPTVVIFGNVDPSFVKPYGSELSSMVSYSLDCKPCHQSFCKFGTKVCIKMITVNDVYIETSNIIKKLSDKN